MLVVSIQALFCTTGFTPFLFSFITINSLRILNRLITKVNKKNQRSCTNWNLCSKIKIN